MPPQRRRRPPRRPGTRGTGPANRPGGPSQRPRAGGSAGRGQRPLRPTPAATPLRRAVERRSAAPLLYLRSLPRLVPPLLLLVVAAAAVLTSPWLGVPLLGVVLVFLGWLTYLSWPVLATGGKVIRLLSLLVVAAVVVSRLV